VEAAEMLEVITAIAENRLPCRQCGKVHETHPVTVKRQTSDIRDYTYESWADPDDGHSYFRMSPAQYASEYLSR
jgi:hypothetical protein